jgi:hypothetical protein
MINFLFGFLDRFVIRQYPSAMKRHGVYFAQKALQRLKDSREAEGKKRALFRNSDFVSRYVLDDPEATEKINDLDRKILGIS